MSGASGVGNILGEFGKKGWMDYENRRKMPGYRLGNQRCGFGRTFGIYGEIPNGTF